MAPSVTLRPYQEDAIRTAFEWIRAGRKRFILQSPTGCHRAGQGIRMHDGSVVPVEMVAVGDRVLGMYGQPRIVLKVHRGRQQMVRIVPEVGAPFVVNKYHTLTLLNGNTLVDFLVRDWLQLSPSAQRLFDLFRVPAAMAHAASISPSQFERTKFHAEPLDIESFYGFELDGDGRYLLDDYTVTHNSGKTVLAARLILAARKQGAKSLFVAHRQELITQAVNKLIEAGIDKSELNLIMPGHQSNMNRLIHVGSIQSLANRILPSELKLIIIDEAHRSAAKSYGKLFELPNVTICGATATPERLDGKPLDMFDDILVVAQPKTLIDQGFIVEPRTFTVPDNELPDLVGVHVKNGDYDPEELDDAVAKRHLVGSIVAHRRYRADGLRTIVFANSIKHSHMIVEEFLADGVAAEHVDGESSESHRKGVIERLRSGETMVVSQMGLWIEGVDIPEVKCGILARPTKSLTVHLQCLDAASEVLTRRGWIGHADIRDDDLVAALDPVTSEVTWEPLLGKTIRPLREDETMFELAGPGTDLRVTGDHRMLKKFKTISDKVDVWPGEWSFSTAEKLVSTNHPYRIPVAGYESAGGLGLSDDELRFIGWWLSDGTHHRKDNGINIAQSSESPHLNDLRQCLTACGFGFREYCYPRKPGSCFPNGKPLVHFNIAYGKNQRLRGDRKHLRGWYEFEPFLDKDFPRAFEQATRKELLVMLEGLHLGDGSKQPDEDWTQRSYHISTGNKLFADRLQSLCVRRGLRCSVSKFTTRKNPYYLIHIKETDFRSFGGKDHTSFHRSESTTREIVWCVTNRIGTIFVRRNGKVCVTGNSIGRVVRPYGGITPIILDHAGNTVDLGLMSQDRTYDIFARRTKREMEEAVRGWRCDVCLFVNPPSAPACTVCGAEKPKKPKKILRTVDGTLVEVGNTPETRKEYWEQLWRRAYTNGELATWVVERYKKRFNEPPPDNWGPTPRPKKEFVWKHAANDAYLWQQVAAKQGMPQDWVRKKLKMKYDVECDPSMAPLEYINTLDEPGMAKRRERIAEQYTKRGMPVPEPVQYGASTIIPNKELHAALSLFKAAPEGSPVASAPATPGPVPNFGLPATAITPQRVAPSPPRAAKPSTIMTSSLSNEDADKQFDEEGTF